MIIARCLIIQGRTRRKWLRFSIPLSASFSVSVYFFRIFLYCSQNTIDPQACLDRLCQCYNHSSGGCFTLDKFSI